MNQNISISEMAESVNYAVFQAGNKTGRTMTMAFIAVDLLKGGGVYLNAGHNQVYLRHANDVTSLIHRSSKLGQNIDSAFVVEEFPFTEGDYLFAFTDGLVENRSIVGKTMSDRGLARLIRQNENGEVVAKELEKYSEKNLIASDSDDTAFVMIQWFKRSGKKVA